MTDHRQITVKYILGGEEGLKTVSLFLVQVKDLVHPLCTALVVLYDRPGFAIILQKFGKFRITFWLKVVSY